MLGLVVLLFVMIAMIVFSRKRNCNRSDRFELPRTPGAVGERLLYRELCNLYGCKKIVSNCYIPKGNGDFTEIDLILLHDSGVYVFESKDYSGWIFGDEKNQYWTQTFRGGRKERFYNPIRQNNMHIKYLQRFLPSLPREYIQSVIVFGERCELKKIDITTNQHAVIKRNQVLRFICCNAKKQVLSPETIDALYQRLLAQTQLSVQEKQAHARRVSIVINKQQMRRR